MQGRYSIMGGAQPVEEAKPDAATEGFRIWRALRVGCLLAIIGLCAGVGALVMALQSGPVELKVPGESFLKIGSDDFVMSNYSFQNGTTYYLDIDGNGVRNIVQLHYMTDSRELELVLHHASKEALRDTNLLTVPIP